MARQWRIRHKLILGLGLVAGIIALLLAGTLKGLESYSSTRKSIESKLAELHAARSLHDRVKELESLIKSQPNSMIEAGELNAKAEAARQALTGYEGMLRETLNHHRDPEKGYREWILIDALRERFADLDQLIKQIDKVTTEMTSNAGTSPLQAYTQIGETIRRMLQATEDLQEEIHRDMYARTNAAKGAYRTSMFIVVSTSVLGILLLVFNMRFFYRWVFYPIRDLQQGVGRVAQGDFEHRIEVHSGDEMEDLAAAFNDMTGRLREMYRDLAHQVNERSRQLVRSERLASVGFLAAGVAHEINNPLASIAFCSEALEGRLADILEKAPAESETVTKYLRMIQQEAFRCKAITQRLLEFSRSGERRREPTDLADLIQSVLDVVQHLQTSKGKEIVFEPVSRPLAWVNAQEIKSVVLNLVVNALDSMDEDGTLTITLGQRDRMAEIVFADTGCGMSPEILENIFEPFFTRSRTGKGTGLGLAISHRVITQHGGEIEALSPGLGKGSTFTVRLPLQSAEHGDQPSALSYQRPEITNQAA